VASIIEVLAVVGGVAVAIGALVSVVSATYGRSESVEKALDRWVSQSKKDRENRPARRRDIHPEAIGAGLVAAVRHRNRQSYAQKLMGIRRVDARTGGEIAARAAILHYLVSQLITVPATVVTNRALERRRKRFNAMALEVRQLNREHGDDVTGLLLDAFKLARKHKADPFTPISLDLGARIAVHLACVLALPKRQSLPDLVSGIATIKDTKP
jgi:hypothetical protein